MQLETGSDRQCPDFEDLSCFVDDELAADRTATVGDHVAACARCAGLTARLRQGFGEARGAFDGAAGSARCTDEEELILYLTRGLSDADRQAVEAHLSRCDACVYGVSLLHRRLRIDETVDQPVPAALRARVRELIEAGGRDLAGQSAPSAPVDWLHRVRDGLDRFLRLPVLVPVAVAAGALLVIGVQRDVGGPGSSGIRAVEQVADMRVTAARALVRELPRATGVVVAEVKAGDIVRVASEDRDWYRVILADQRSGWVEREAFE